MAWTAPRTWVAGETITAAILNQHIRDELKALGDPWQAYTPAWDSSGTTPSVGNGTLTGAYVSFGKLCMFRLTLTMGSTTNFGTGNYRWTLPVTAAGVLHDPLAGSGTCWDNSATDVRGRSARLFSNNKVMLTDGSGADVALGVPFTWATNDTISIAASYEAS